MNFGATFMLGFISMNEKKNNRDKNTLCTQKNWATPGHYFHNYCVYYARVKVLSVKNLLQTCITWKY